jgi:ABC-2 type transport system permease protein
VFQDPSLDQELSAWENMDLHGVLYHVPRKVRHERTEFAFLVLIAIVFAALGTAIGSSLKDMQGYTAVMNFLVLPIFLLSGTLFPLDNLPSLLAALTRVDPLSYGVDGLRATLIARTHFGALLDAAVLGSAAVVLTVLGAWRFSMIEI